MSQSSPAGVSPSGGLPLPALLAKPAAHVLHQVISPSTLLANWGSLLTLKLFTRWGLRTFARQIRRRLAAASTSARKPSSPTHRSYPDPSPESGGPPSSAPDGPAFGQSRRGPPPTGHCPCYLLPADRRGTCAPAPAGSTRAGASRQPRPRRSSPDRKSTRLNSSH